MLCTDQHVRTAILRSLIHTCLKQSGQTQGQALADASSQGASCKQRPFFGSMTALGANNRGSTNVVHSYICMNTLIRVFTRIWAHLVGALTSLLEGHEKSVLNRQC